MKSILQDEKECYVTGRADGLQEHHVYFGCGQRSVSEKNGFKVFLRPEYHLACYDGSVHACPGQGLDFELKQACQLKFEETHTREDFMRLIGRNYL
jgi:hypothetical protein